jgi:acetyltransferase-like isoleucine patch superfamily enzyme
MADPAAGIPRRFTKESLRQGIAQFGWVIGDHTYGTPKIIGRQSKLSIGKFCSIASGVRIFCGGEHRSDWVTTYPFPAAPERWPDNRVSGPWPPGLPTAKGDVVIGHDVWIGQNATILSGTKIGDGAVIANSAVVMTDVPEYGIAVGNPARTYKKRFSDEIIARLLRMQWWDWPDDKIREAIPYMSSTDIESFLNKFESK